MCFYNLEKDFDSVEYLVMLERLYEVGVMGRLAAIDELV